MLFASLLAFETLIDRRGRRRGGLLRLRWLLGSGTGCRLAGARCWGAGYGGRCVRRWIHSNYFSLLIFGVCLNAVVTLFAGDMPV